MRKNEMRNGSLLGGGDSGLSSVRTIERLAASAHYIVPGHDPLVMRRYPAPSVSLQDVVVRLDADPVA